jgi:energy-coupling factor transporter ATP-binding protein EcfA2
MASRAGEVDADEVARVAAYLTAWVEERGEAVGARIGQEMGRVFPTFSLRAAGFQGLTDFLDRATAELSIVGRSGDDVRWSTRPNLNLDLDRVLLVEGAERDVPSKEPWLVGANDPITIDRLELQNFKCVRSASVPLRPLTVLVGANGAGKSSVLQALFLLSQLRHNKPGSLFRGPWAPERLRTTNGRGELRLTLQDTAAGQEVSYVARQTETGVEHRVEAKVRSWAHVYDFARPLGSSAPPLRDLPIFRAVGGTILLGLEARRLAAASALGVEPSIAPDGSGLPSVLADLAATAPDRLQAIFEATRAVIPSFGGARMPRAAVPRTRREVRSIDGERHERTVEDALVGNALQIQVSGQWIDADLASEGTLLMLGLMTIVHGQRGTRLLLMDDIDRALHPKAQRQLMQHLKQLTTEGERLQIVCTTHSPYLLDGVEPEDVVVVRAEEGGAASFRRLTEHPEWVKWRGELAAGEFWSYVGEDWLESAP